MPTLYFSVLLVKLRVQRRLRIAGTCGWLGRMPEINPVDPDDEDDVAYPDAERQPLDEPPEQEGDDAAAHGDGDAPAG